MHIIGKIQRIYGTHKIISITILSNKMYLKMISF